MVVEDLFNLQQLDEAAASPDGKWLAVVVARAATRSETYRDFPAPGDVGRADVWLVPVRGGQPRNLTNGVADGSGFWNPVWSPDSKSIAMLSTRGGDNVRPYLWDAATSALRRLTDRGADLEAWGYEGYPKYAMLWVDSTTVLCPVTAEGEGGSHGMTGIQAYVSALKEWSAASKGMEPTVSVLESNASPSVTARRSGALLAIDVVSNQSRVLGSGNFRRLLLSPSGRDLALIAETGRLQPKGDRALPWEEHAYDLRRGRLGFLSLRQLTKVVWADSLLEPNIPAFNVPHAWSPDGSLLAVIARWAGDEALPARLFLVSAATAAIQPVAKTMSPVSATAWSYGGRLLALISADADSHSDRQPREDWWVVPGGEGERPTNVTSGLPETPTSFFPTRQRDTMLYLAAGELWSINIRSGESKNLTRGIVPPIERLMLPAEMDHSGRDLQSVLIATRENNIYRVAFIGSDTRIAQLPRPSPYAIAATFRPDHDLIVFTSAEPTGLFLWTGSLGSFYRVISLNEHVHEIADAKRLLIKYQGADGDSLNALLVLPVGYRPGRRYPLVTWVYPAVRITDTLYVALDKHLSSWANLNLLPAHGYALLIPSTPVRLAGAGTDLYTDLPKGVMGAVERVIALGFADPSRLGVMGHSAGGYAVNVLVTYTDRFKAAVAVAGFSDLVSQYGVFVATQRHDDHAHENLFPASWLESGFGLQMGGPPWQQLWRYLRNSPYFYVDRIRTPLMIVQGDMDHVPLQQGEELFTALYRLGKKASFVRYWGEGHDVSSPANVLDMWQRMLAWFDDCLGAGESDRQDGPVAGRSGRLK